MILSSIFYKTRLGCERMHIFNTIKKSELLRTQGDVLLNVVYIQFQLLIFFCVKKGCLSYLNAPLCRTSQKLT